MLVSRLFCLLLTVAACTPSGGVLHSVTAPDGRCGYADAQGQLVIPYGKYLGCFTEDFRTVAIVQQPTGAFVMINRQERVLFRVMTYDNGPDYPAEGMIRILDAHNRIGYATPAGAVVIPPQFDAAFPFQGAMAKVGRTCRTVADGEHSAWECTEWFYIDKQGRKLRRLIKP